MTPAPANDGVALNGVACPAANECFAVGNRQISASAADLRIEKWNGATWSDVPAAAPKGALWSLFNSISCLSATDCWAMGDGYDSPTSSGYFFADQYDGKGWRLVSMANPSKFDLGSETGMVETACTTASRCLTVGMALGYIPPGQRGADFPTGVAEAWDGTRWSALAVPKGASGQGYGPTGAACVSASDCWVSAVPTGPLPAWYAPMTFLHWTGAGLTAQTLPVHAGGEAIGCLSTGFCLAFGQAATSSPSAGARMASWRLSPGA
jgi:hypothetical protein